MVDLTASLSGTLPPGVHPGDRTGGYESTHIPADTAPTEPSPTGRQPWSTSNTQALGVNQRSASAWQANTYVVSTPTKIANRQPGRALLLLWVPTGAAAGVAIGPDEGTVANGGGTSLAPGDSLTLPLEAVVWAGPIGAALTGTIAVIALLNPLGS